MMAAKYLKDAIVEYIKNNPGKHFDSVDLVGYFKLRADITMDAIGELMEEDRLTRHYIGLQTYYTAA